ncbi:uncharacterized protein CIMG_13443 [Coccidioides immitis RS]|uniref:Uncharacterized protein n=1 Tax=Coccidioides immitis (strain RS) TaxID=246410 RepID=J3KF44_COCIM|nr:uncharacterized protein CIMG_13443 [Coccidioides immitis RS]EAS34201.3 hypothetical protein CIMG_13443 [Coccidioides immitis RS]
MWLQAVVGEEGLAGDAADVSWMNSWFVLYNNSMASMYACRHAKIQPMAPTMQFCFGMYFNGGSKPKSECTGRFPKASIKISRLISAECAGKRRFWGCGDEQGVAGSVGIWWVR